MNHNPLNVLTKLRQLVPNRPLRFSEAMHLAELQARRLLELAGVTALPVSCRVITDLPQIRIVDDPQLPLAGASHWDPAARQWVIRLNPTDSAAQRRFTLLHEFKHILDFGGPGLLPIGLDQHQLCTDQLAEQIADHFATCALLPKRLVREAWAAGTPAIAALATRCDAPPSATRSRLIQLGLIDPATRTGRPHEHPDDISPSNTEATEVAA
ncbi:ImmA/IrrE family metallo-endopeptidase [Blastococcus colisei]|uniref:ImmA/IrrE family metallo-endopeptidase n=1 Tax=Blastococcus colisei TaxID=1564162 RepID=UPI0014777561|nr:ImmA/IrrE family metallo-endopeptidase [Blastococcus colisei]